MASFGSGPTMEMDDASNIDHRMDYSVTTPEKLDSISRRGHESRNFCDRIGLLLCDEIHTLGESRGRGACLEGVISRYFKRICQIL